MAGNAARLVEVWRGAFCESVHAGHVAIWHADTGLIGAWGDANSVVLPRSSAKMIQALPLIESGAAKAFDVGSAQLALACASHDGAAVHAQTVRTWLNDLDLTDDALRCGVEWPRDPGESRALIRHQGSACQRHCTCSGKHAGFLTLGKHLAAGPEYLTQDHPVQIVVKDAFEDVTETDSPGWVIDGCSAPNHATPLFAMARAMAAFAAADASTPRGRAMVALREAMMAHPHLVAGETGACTRIMQAAQGKAAVKFGAEGFYVAILPGRRIGVALKIVDGAQRAAEVVVAQLLVGLGVLDPDDPIARAYTHGPIRNLRGIATGQFKPADELAGWQG